jgi:hypothetical protein
MSRALFLKLTEAEVIAKCDSAKVGISALEKLPAGGVRLVCMSSDGAATMTRKLKSSLIADTAKRAPFRPLHSRG